MKLKLAIIILLGFIILVTGVWVKNSWNDEDVTVAIIDQNGITLKTLSWQRRMVNELQIEPDVQIWIPKGMGWYRSGDLNKVAKQEKNLKMMSEVLFYNFGFTAKIVKLDEGEYSYGLMNDLRYFWAKSEMMNKKEIVNDSLIKSEVKLDEILPRDFADGRLLREDIRVSIYNLSQSNGLANFGARFLERAGVTILSVDTAENDENIKMCQINFGPKTKNSEVGNFIERNLVECDHKIDERLADGEIDLYFGDGYAKMLNYESYNQNNQ